jgi:hypothetical protein
VQVQRNWQYLENIFIGSEDIRKQLLQESIMFDGVNQVFMHSMAQLHAVGNVIQATNAPGVLATFQVCSEACWVHEQAHQQDIFLMGALRHKQPSGPVVLNLTRKACLCGPWDVQQGTQDACSNAMCTLGLWL